MLKQMFSISLMLELFGCGGPVTGKVSAEENPSPKIFFEGSYVATSDLSHLEGKLPQSVSVFRDYETKTPTVVVTDQDGESRRFALGSYHHSSGSTSNAASIRVSNENELLWVAKLNQASSFDDYLEVTWTVEFQRVGNLTGLLISWKSVSFHYTNGEFKIVNKQESSERYLLERIN